MSRGDTPSAFNPAITSDSDVPSGPRNHDRLTLGEGVRLHHLGFLGNPQRQVALAYGHPRNAHIAPHHDRAGPLIDDDAGAQFGLHRQILNAHDRTRGRTRPRRTDIEHNRTRIGHLGDGAAELAIDRPFDPVSRREIRADQRQAYRRASQGRSRP